MKKIFVLFLAVISLSKFSYPQENIRIGLNAGGVNPLKLAYDVNGFGMNAEGTYTIAENFDFTASIGWNEAHFSDKFDYKQIPLLVGARYYLFNYYFKPYVALEAGVSYCDIDQEEIILTRNFSGQPEAPVLQTHRSSQKELLFGFSPNLGVMVPIVENIDLFVNLRIHYTSNSKGSYSLFSGGFNFPI
jgi:hypothetical protein